MRDIWALSDTAVDHAREEMLELQARAEKAEMSLEDVRASLKGEVNALRSKVERVEYELEVAQRKAANELDSAMVAEEKQKLAEEKMTAMESEMQVLKGRLHSTTVEAGVVKERAEEAEEAVRQFEAMVADLKVTTSVAERKIAEAEKRVAEAEKRATEAEKKVVDVERGAMEAVEIFKKSEAFDKELAESTVFAYENGFKDCKEKIRRLYNLEGIEELEPDDVRDDDNSTPVGP